MRMEGMTLALFAACNGLRIFAYLPQIHKAAIDSNGASAISYTTWTLFLLAHLSTVAYALVYKSDAWLAACFAGNAACCVAILGIAYWKHVTRSSLDPNERPLSKSQLRFAREMGIAFKLCVVGRFLAPGYRRRPC